MIVGLASFILLRLFLLREFYHRSLPYPAASTWLPVIGVPVAFGMRGLEFLREQHRKLGNVFLVDLLVLRFHFVLGAEAIKKFYKAPNEELDFLAGVPDIMPELVEDAWDIDPSFQAKGHQLALKGFSQKDRLDHALVLLTNEIDKAIVRWTAMDKVDIFEECNRLTVMVTLRFILGDEICDERGDELADLYDTLEKDLADPMVMTLRPLPTTPFRRLIKTRNTLLSIMRECVDRKIKDQATDKSKTDQSFLQMLMNELGPEYWYQYGFLCLGIILATRTNTAGVLAWTFTQLCNDKDGFMKRVEEELEKTGCFEPGMGDVGSGKPYPFKEFSFLDACMKESVRSYSNFLQFRKVMKKEGFEIEPGKTVPQGALICISPAESHHNEEIFEDAYTYTPDRWLAPQYGATRVKDMSYVQWGYLRHRCYGEKFAQQFDKVAWARIITKCHVENAIDGQKVPEPLWGSGFGTSFPLDNAPYMVRIRLRAESQ
ncbi:MAG: hypothetical protein SGCHY_002516 [Lobulomycetales sp.]